MILQSTQIPRPTIGIPLNKLAVQCAALVFLWGVNADVAYARDRYRCTPTDGSPSYTSPGSCRSTDAREPLSEQEMAEQEAIEKRGRPFTRCTAADGSYSFFVYNDKECPSATDTRTTEYAVQGVQRAREASGPSEASATPQPSTTPKPAANASPPAVATAPASVSPPRSGTGWFIRMLQFALLVLGIWGIVKWMSLRSEKSKAAERLEREARAEAIAQRRRKPTPETAAAQSPPKGAPINMQEKSQASSAAQSARADVPGTAALDENQRCAQMLEAFFSDTEIQGGLAYRAQLKLAQLDYSLASLERLDQLLRFIRPEIKRTYEQFVNTSDTQNFLRWLGFYIGMTMARVGATAVKWLDFAQAKQNIPELEFQFETTSICLLGGRTYFPLGLVTEILLQPDPQRNVPAWAREAIKLAPPPVPSILQSSVQVELTSPLDPQMALAVRKAGFVAAWCMFMVEGGSVGAPTLYVPGPGETGTFRDFSFYDSADSAIAAAHGIMQSNPDRVPFQVMSFDGYANLHTGRTDALTIELRIYASSASPSQVAFSIVVACPYRNANDPKGFAIHSPKLLECTAAADLHSAIFKYFYLGIKEFKAKEFDWFKYLDERV